MAIRNSWTIPLPSGPPERYGQILAELANGGDLQVNLPGWAAGEYRTDVHLDDEQTALLQRWLKELPEPRERVLKEIATAAVGVKASESRTRVEVKKGRINRYLDLLFACPTPESAIAWMFAELLGGGMGENIRSCKECGVFFFDKPSGRPMKQFCKPEHSNAYRQRKYRSRSK